MAAKHPKHPHEGESQSAEHEAKRKYCVLEAGTVINDQPYAVGDEVGLTEADALRHTDAGIPLSLIEE